MSDYDVPPFDEAVKRFRGFLAKTGYHTDIQWIFREQTVDLWLQVFVKTPLGHDVHTVAQLYDRGRAAGLGVSLNTFCLLDDRPCCYIWLPMNREDASYRMLSSLKFSSQPRTEIRHATAIAGSIRWAWLKWRERRSKRPNWASDIPIRPRTSSRTVHDRPVA